MGLPFANHSGEENGIGSISFGNDGDKMPFRSLGHNSPDSESMVMKSLDSGIMRIEGSISLEVSMKSQQINNQCSSSQMFSILDPCSPKHEAAIKLQKVYKSFRTRRKLADCAVLVEQSWWKLLDFAELKRSSISFFEIEKHETAISRWSRARTRAAKVGKGLSKNDKARKLALQHWLEAIDPRHRYGHNLHFYYVKWLHSHSREPFFYWLDIGEGREVNLMEKCPRLKLQQQCIKYLGPMEREVYEVVVEDGKFLFKQTGELLHTNADEDAKWIFVLSTSKTLYVGRKKKGTFQHSSFLAGGATTAAGRLVVDNGTLKAVWPHSGHYRPTEENFKDFISFLEENNVDLSDVKMSPVEEEEDSFSEQRSKNHFRNNSSGEDLILQQLNVSEIGQDIRQADSTEQQVLAAAAPAHPESSHLRIFSRNLTNLEIPRKGEFLSTSEAQSPNLGQICTNTSQEEEPIVLQRIKKMESYQLGKQLSCRWTTGAGPRIGCVRDYPAELQVRALEQLCLSPRSASPTRMSLSRTETAARMMRSSSVPEKGMFFAEKRSIGHSVSWMKASSPLCREKMENYSIGNKTMIDDLISF